MDRKKIPKDFEENRTRVFSPRNRYPSDSATLPSAAKLQSRLPYTIGSDPRLQRFVRWSDGSDSGSMGYVGEYGQWGGADGWFTGRIHRELTVRIRTCPTMEADHDLAMS